MGIKTKNDKRKEVRKMAIGPEEVKNEEERRAKEEAELLEKIIDFKIRKREYEEKNGMIIIKIPPGVIEMGIAEKVLKERYLKVGWKKVEIALESDQEKRRDLWVIRLFYA